MDAMSGSEWVEFGTTCVYSLFLAALKSVTFFDVCVDSFYYRVIFI